MWPFSTIARLKKALTDAYAEADRHEVRYDKKAIAFNIAAEQLGSAQRELADYRDRWTSLNENFEALEAASKNLTKENADLQIQLADAEAVVADLKAHLAEFDRANLKLHDEKGALQAQLIQANADIADLKAQLAEAQKNDKRDPKTGKFVKA